MTKLKQLGDQLGQWPPTTSTVIGLGLLVGAIDYLLTGNAVQAVAAAGLFKVLCPEDAAGIDKLTTLLSQLGKLCLVGAVVAGITGCSQVATLAEPDAALAFSLASNPAMQQLDPGAAARAQCWGAWKVLTGGLAAASGQGGIMTTIESLSEARAVFKSPQCAPIIADIALYIAGKVPFSPL